MLKFIDTQYEKFTWLLVFSGIILFFIAKEYLWIVLFSFLLIKAVKLRNTIRTTPIPKLVIQVGLFILLIAVLAIIIIASASFMKEHNVPVFLRYAYLIVVLFIASSCYEWATNFLMKIWNK